MTIKGLEGKLIARKGKKAEIEIEGQKIIVPLEQIPSSLNAGDTFRAYFLDSNEATLQEKKLAKEILSEILNGK